MALTTAQIAVLKADILANPDLHSQPMSNLGSQEIARLYNMPSTTDVWRPDASTSAIKDAIDWTKYTPQDAIPAIDAATGNGAIHTFVARGELIQIKQNNLYAILVGLDTLDATKPTLRSGLRDATTALPAGVNGASVSAGGAAGVNVLNAMMRKATRFEKLFATSDSATGAVTAKLLVIEGAVSSDDIQTARESV
jgi:hypothetical protein